tara:strand:+ start:153 stop:758 length:606 start_codon:yes stop_codon:yes gene_type:complete
MSKANFKLEQLFGSKTRARLLGLFLQNPDEVYFVRELTRKIDAQLNSVRRELENLLALGAVISAERPEDATGSDKKKYYTANVEFMLFDDLASLLQKSKILLKKNLVHQIESKGKIDYLSFTGKFVGEQDVPTDIVIVGSIDQKALQRVVKGFETELGDEINYTLMPREEFLYRKQITDRFLFSILEREQVVMIDRLKTTK